MPMVGMGVRFIDLSSQHRALIEQVLYGKPSRRILEPQNPACAPAPPSPIPMIMIMSGSLADVNLFDIIHIIESSTLTGLLAVRTPDQNGEIYFNDGQIVSVRAGARPAAGALNKFLGATEGWFEFKKSDERFERTINAGNNASLILDLIKAKDEGEEARLEFADG